MTCGKKYYHQNIIPDNQKSVLSYMRMVIPKTKIGQTNVFSCVYTKALRKFKETSTGFAKLKTAYDGEQVIPITRVGDEIHLIANVSFGGKSIQFVMYDLKNMSENAMQSEFSNSSQVVQQLNKNTKYSIVHFNINKYGPAEQTFINAYYCILCFHMYLYDIHNRVGLINSPHVLVSFVNLCMTNAFWSDFFMVFGNGKDTPGVKPLTSMDVCCHELTHGLIANTVDLQYQGESGALNESFADILGTCLEFYINNSVDSPDWTIGEEFLYVIRDMSDPKKYQQPTTYNGEYWTDTSSVDDNGGVHTNSGVTNYCCYLAANGTGIYKNDVGNTIDLTNSKAISLFDFSKLIYFILVNRYISSSATFNDFAKAMLRAADSLKMTNKNRLQQCMYAVNIIDNSANIKDQVSL